MPISFLTPTNLIQTILNSIGGISIYQEIENWRICRLNILNLIRIKDFNCKQLIEDALAE